MYVTFEEAALLYIPVGDVDSGSDLVALYIPYSY